MECRSIHKVGWGRSAEHTAHWGDVNVDFSQSPPQLGLHTRPSCIRKCYYKRPRQVLRQRCIATFLIRWMRPSDNV